MAVSLGGGKWAAKVGDLTFGVGSKGLAEAIEYQVVCLLKALQAENEQLRAALTEAMRVRHFCDMEQSCEKHERDKPYTFDEYLRRWAEALGERVYSDWPNV